MGEVGEAICTRLEDGRVRVDRADPYIRISLDLLEGLSNSPHAIFDNEGGSLTIGDINPVTYKIGDVVGDYVEAERIP
jgi:hypothetical protein